MDFVLRGDSTEEPCRQLLQAMREGTPLEAVENLTWKRPDGTVVVNPLTFVPADLDWIDVPAYDFMLHAVFKYAGFADFLPYLHWLRYPSTMLLNSRGCTYDCSICGGSRSAYRSVVGRPRAAMRSPEKLVADAKLISTFSRAPIFMVHDPRVGGLPRSRRFFDLFAAARIPNELVVELFFPANREFFRTVAAATHASSIVYAYLTWSVVVEVAGAVVSTNHWVLDTSVFFHMVPAPASAPDWSTAAVLAGLGLFGALAGCLLLDRRDVVGA